MLGQEFINHLIRCGDLFVDQGSPQRDHVLPLGVLVDEEHLQSFKV